MRARLWGPAVAALLVSACGGEDKKYGDPIDDPSAAIHASGAISNTLLLREDTTNDTALNALNALSGNVNLLAGIKLQHLQGGQQPQAAPLRDVDAACVVVSNSGVVYSNCEWAGNVVNGSVSRSGNEVDVDLDFDRSDTDTTTSIDIVGHVALDDAALVGFIDIDLNMTFENGSVSATFDSDFDVTLAEGCAIDGDLEVHAVASGNGARQSVWVLADYGPACGDVVVR